MIKDVLPIVGTFIVGLIAIFQDKIKAKLDKRFNIYLILVLVIATGWQIRNSIISDNALITEKIQKKKDSADMKHHFDTVLNGLKADTTKLNRTNKLLMDTRDTLSRRLANNSLSLAEKINLSGKGLLKNLKDLNDQITGGAAILTFGWKINGHKNYNAVITNYVNHTLQLNQMHVTDFDKLTGCKHDDSFGSYKIDRRCFLLNTQFFPDTNSNQPMQIGSDNTEIVDWPMPKVVGTHRYEIQFSLRNLTYYEQFIFVVNADFSILQAGRVIKPNGKSYKVLFKIKSNDKQFNDSIDWDKLFPIPYSNRLYYSLK